MNTFQLIHQDGSILSSGDQYRIREYIEERLENLLGFFTMLQESVDEGYFELYLHTDNYDDLSEDELSKLDELKITDVDSLSSILSVLNISRIEIWEEKEKETCSCCGKSYHEDSINMIDFQDDVCINCLPHYEQN